jgi:3-isopropylmalate dehydrogenase
LTGGLFWRKKLNESGTIASDLCEYSEEEIARISTFLNRHKTESTK